MSFTLVSSLAGRYGLLGGAAAINSTGANFLVAIRVSNLALPAPTDTYNNTWTLVGSWSTDVGGVITAHYADNASVGIGHQLGQPNSFSGMALLAFNRDAGALVAGPSAGRLVPNSSAPSAGGITPTQAPSLILAALGLGAVTGSATAPSPFATALFADGVPGQTYGIAVSQMLQDPAAAIDPAWTLGNSVTTSAAVMSFAVSAGAPPPPPPPPALPTITTLPLRNEGNTLLPNTTIANVLALRLSDGVEAARWSGAVTDAQGLLVLQSANLTAVPHLLVTYSADGAARGIGLYTPVMP